MHIKEIRIKGFRSYRDLTIVEGLDPGFNIFVGRNGSGKSNLFAAIEFALTLEHRNLRPADRAALAFDGNPITDAFVEVVFDNSDRRLEPNSDTVVFRRAIGPKKDKFFCNGAPVSNAKQFLDNAGFSNPYFVVKQGKVHQLATASDAQRLKLLEDVMGSTSFADKLTDFHKLVKEADKKRAEVEEIMVHLDERQKVLEQEATGLKKYMKRDAQRRSIEHILNERQQSAARQGLTKFDAKREELSEKTEPIILALNKLKEKKNNALSELAEIQKHIRSVEEQKHQIDQELPLLLSERERLKNLRSDLENPDPKELKHAKKAITNLKKELVAEEEKLSEAREKLSAVKEKESSLEKEIIGIATTMNALELQLGDSGSRNLIQALSTAKTERKKTVLLLTEAEKKLASINDEKNESSKGLEERRKGLDILRGKLAELEKASKCPDAELFNANQSRRETLDKISHIGLEFSELQNRSFVIKDQLIKAAGREAILGWEGVQRVIDELKKQGEREILEGYYGIMLENMTCQPEFDLAVEAAGGNKLLAHVVQNHRVSKRIMQVFNRMKCRGSPQFIPVEEIMCYPTTYPVGRQYNPLLNCIQYAQELETVFRHTFGTTLLCRDLSDVTEARGHMLTCVTLDGDKVSRGGAMSGGYRVARLEKIELQRRKSEIDKELERITVEKDICEEQLRDLDANIRNAITEKESRTTKKLSIGAQKEQVEKDVRLQSEALRNLEKGFLSMQNRVERLLAQKEELECRIQKIQELTSRTSQPSSQEDREKAQDLRKQLKTLTQSKKAILAEKGQLEKPVLSSTESIRQIEQMIDEAKCKVLEISSNVDGQQIQQVQEMIRSMDNNIRQKNKEIQELEVLLPSKVAKASEQKGKIDKIEEEEKSVTLRLKKLSNEMHQMLTFSSGFNAKLQDAIQAAALLETLPADADDFQEKTTKELSEDLRKIKGKLSKQGNVNLKAIIQHKEITEQYQSHAEKLGCLEEDRTQMNDLIRDLETRKGQMIINCFHVLKGQFEEIFERIVPTGKAEMVLYGSDFEINSGSDSDSNDIQRRVGSPSAQGVKINVNFRNRNILETCNLMQLSGGQKAVVALCLILAIQRVDPVPFYLFDEVDQALDAQYRSAVAKVIYNLAAKSNLQFICTTFRKEFVFKAHKFFGVAILHQCSTVREVSAEEAMNFVQREPSTQGNDGSSDSGDNGTSKSSRRSSESGDNGTSRSGHRSSELGDNTPPRSGLESPMSGDNGPRRSGRRRSSVFSFPTSLHNSLPTPPTESESNLDMNDSSIEVERDEPMDFEDFNHVSDSDVSKGESVVAHVRNSQTFGSE